MEAAAITWQKMRTSATTTAVTRVNIHISITIEVVTHREKQLKRKYAPVFIFASRKDTARYHLRDCEILVEKVEGRKGVPTTAV